MILNSLHEQKSSNDLIELGIEFAIIKTKGSKTWNIYVALLGLEMSSYS